MTLDDADFSADQDKDQRPAAESYSMYEFIQTRKTETKKSVSASKSAYSTRSASRAAAENKSLSHKHVKEHAEFTEY